MAAGQIESRIIFRKAKSMMIESKIKIGHDSMFDINQATFKSTHLLNKITLVQFQRNSIVCRAFVIPFHGLLTYLHRD